MAYLHLLFAACVHYSVFCHWMFVGATGSLTSASNLVQSSVVTHSFGKNTSIPSPRKTVTSTKVTVTSSSSSVVPSPRKTVKPGNLTVTASFNGTVTPQNMTITPSHMTTAVLNSSVMPPSTGTIRPTPVPTVLPSSTVHPTPTSLPPGPGNFTVKNNGTVCLFAYMAAKFDVTTSSKKLTFELPKNAKSSGECDTRSKDHPFIKLSWSTHSHDCSFTMHFEKFSKDTTTNTVTQYWMAANLTFSVKFNNSTTVFHSVKETFHALSAGIGDAYACPSAPAINLTAKKSSAEVTLTRFKFQPFGVKSGHFGNVTNCVHPTTPTASPSTSPPKTKQPNRQHESHTVAIAVGCSLAGLALVAVIGYLIWRHCSRNNQGGYRKL